MNILKLENKDKIMAKAQILNITVTQEICKMKNKDPRDPCKGWISCRLHTCDEKRGMYTSMARHRTRGDLYYNGYLL